jgi:hypothetical protein
LRIAIAQIRRGNALELRNHTRQRFAFVLENATRDVMQITEAIFVAAVLEVSAQFLFDDVRGCGHDRKKIPNGRRLPGRAQHLQRGEQKRADLIAVVLRLGLYGDRWCYPSNAGE